MADMTSYKNKYRKYLEDDYDTYMKDGTPASTKVIMGTLATVGIAGGGLLAFRSGKLQGLMHSAIAKAGSYRRGGMVAANESLRRYSEQEGLAGFGKAVKAFVKGDKEGARQGIDDFVESIGSFGEHLDNGRKERLDRMAKIGNSKLIDREVDAQKRFAEQNGVIEDLRNQGVHENHLAFAEKKMQEARIKFGQLDSKEEELRMKQTGFRHATIGDLINAGELVESDEFISSGKKMFEKLTGEAGDFLKSRADRNIMVDMDGNIADLRDFRKTFLGFMESISTDFTIPLVKINPLRMFYADQLFSTVEKPMFHAFSYHQRNPIVTGHVGSVGDAMLFADGQIFRMPGSADKAAEQIAGDFFLSNAQKGPQARLIRNVSGIAMSKFEKPKEDANMFQKARYWLQRLLGIGFQQDPGGQMDVLDPTSWGLGPMNAITGRLRYNDVTSHAEILREAFGSESQFFAMRKAKKIQEVGVKEWMGQLTAGRNNLEDFTFASLFPYGFFERLNATLNQVNLGLPAEDLDSGFSIFKNLMLKRVAPIWAGYELIQYANYESENLTGEQFSDRFAKAYANTSVEVAGIRDRLGITDWAKHVAPLLVGGEQLAEIPVFGNLVDVNQSQEETEDYWLNGEDPVRKGRWWNLGNTPFTGAKIDYFQPNWVRRVLADAKYSDSQYGSREEYFQNSWMPTPRHPFAPIRHFFTDPYHYEEKHYQDRPYMVTGGISEIKNFPLIGPALNDTIGAILKPEKRMHSEYWDTQPTLMQGQADTVDFDSPPPITPELSQEIARQMLPIPTSGTGGGQKLAQVAHDHSKMMAAYVTSSGGVQVLSTDSINNIRKAQGRLSNVSPAHTTGFISERLREPDDDVPLTEPDYDGSLQQALGDLHYNVSEMGGFYGFMGMSITGESFSERPVWQASSEMSSYTRAFWDLDIGGYGGDANEIFRRFLPKDRKVQQINPIRNTMPDWLPGHEYFLDFKHGDPYIKVKKGELRLPGEGYERSHDIDSEDMMKMDIGASYIGYDDQTIREHMLKRDVIKDEAFQRKLDFGTAWHKAWERQMKEQGVGESMEGYVKDEASGIGGFYDLYGKQDNILDWLLANSKEFTYYAPTSGGKGDAAYQGFYKKGVKLNMQNQATQEAFRAFAKSQGEYGLIDPKTRSPQAWENDEMHWENVQQVNFYAGQKHTGVNYLIHVDREHPDRGIKVFAFGYNPELEEYSKQKIGNIRAGIRKQMDDGSLSRADLYEPLDRYRILADVAPYSQEFRDMTTELKYINFSDEEKKEIQQIKKQVSLRKDRIRVYDYRFSTSNLENETVTVDQVLDNNTFTTLEHPDNPIRFAGLRVPMGKDDPIALRAREVTDHTLRPGKRVKIAYDADEHKRIKKDTYQTIQSVVYDTKGRNLNQYLLKNDLAKEKENDYSAAAVHARFSPTEIAFGSMWEKFAHMDTILHTKFLQVRSPLEQYERREVYGRKRTGVTRSPAVVL